MMTSIPAYLIADILWFGIFVGWIVLIVIGLEADKPLSGGIPGHIDVHEQHQSHKWTRGDRIGEIAGWTVFAGISALLPFILHWIWTTHG